MNTFEEAESNLLSQVQSWKLELGYAIRYNCIQKKKKKMGVIRMAQRYKSKRLLVIDCVDKAIKLTKLILQTFTKQKDSPNSSAANKLKLD